MKVVDGLQEALRTTTSERDQALHQLTTQQEDADSSMKKMGECVCGVCVWGCGVCVGCVWVWVYWCSFVVCPCVYIYFTPT